MKWNLVEGKGVRRGILGKGAEAVFAGGGEMKFGAKCGITGVP